MTREEQKEYFKDKCVRVHNIDDYTLVSQFFMDLYKGRDNNWNNNTIYNHMGNNSHSYVSMGRINLFVLGHIGHNHKEIPITEIKKLPELHKTDECSDEYSDEDQETINKLLQSILDKNKK